MTRTPSSMILFIAVLSAVLSGMAIFCDEITTETPIFSNSAASSASAFSLIVEQKSTLLYSQPHQDI